MNVLVLVGLVPALVGCQSTAPESGRDSAPAARELVDLRSRILEYTAGIGPDGTYTAPDKEQRERLAAGVGHLLQGDAGEAERLLATVGFTATRLTDTASGRRYDEVASLRPGEGRRWGRLYLAADSGIHWSAQVPHPVADRHTEELGVRLLEDAPGGALVLAGAHRHAGRGNAADVAHRKDSAFHAVVEELQKRGVPGVQLHGFARASDRPYDAIVSTGPVQDASGEVSALADVMEAGGLRVCRGWSARCPLEGTANVQGESAKRRHTDFVHVELAPGARGDGRDADEAAKALSGLLTTWARD